VNCTEQAPFESLQVGLENLPELLLDQETAPVGPDPLTMALQAEAVPMVTEAFAQDTVTAVPLLAVVRVPSTIGVPCSADTGTSPQMVAPVTAWSAAPTHCVPYQYCIIVADAIAELVIQTSAVP